MALDLGLLESFVLSAETLNFSETAKRRAIAQSAISSHIAKLEQLVGRRLFDRSAGTSMRLTAEGERFLPQAVRILDLAESALQSTRAHTPRVTLRLGTTAMHSISVLPEALTQFSQTTPTVDVQVSTGRSVDLIKQMDAGEFDVILITDQGRRPSRTAIMTLPVTWVGGPGFDPPSQGPIPLAFLPDSCEQRRMGLDALDQAGRASAVTHTSPDPLGVRAIVAAGLAMTILPTTSITPPLFAIPADRRLPVLGTVAVSIYQRLDAKRSEINGLADCLRIQLNG